MGLMDWQMAIVIVVVAAAVFFFVRRLVRQAKGKGESGCDKCGDH
jgi:hypothetical protein